MVVGGGALRKNAIINFGSFISSITFFFMVLVRWYQLSKINLKSLLYQGNHVTYATHIFGLGLSLLGDKNVVYILHVKCC